MFKAYGGGEKNMLNFNNKFRQSVLAGKVDNFVLDYLKAALDNTILFFKESYLL